MVELLQIDGESLVELGDGSGQDDGAARGILLHHIEAMIAGKGPDGGDVVGISAELPREVVAAEAVWRRGALGRGQRQGAGVPLRPGGDNKDAGVGQRGRAVRLERCGAGDCL